MDLTFLHVSTFDKGWANVETSFSHKSVCVSKCAEEQAEQIHIDMWLEPSAAAEYHSLQTLETGLQILPAGCIMEDLSSIRTVPLHKPSSSLSKLIGIKNVCIIQLP